MNSDGNKPEDQGNTDDAMDVTVGAEAEMDDAAEGEYSEVEFDDDDLDADEDEGTLKARKNKKIKMPKTSGGGGNAARLLAPIVVLVIAAGAGGYIVMNPQILAPLSGGASPAPAPVSNVAALDVPAPAPAEQQQAAAVPIDEEFNMPAFGGETPPQPTANQNEVPRAPDDATAAVLNVDDITETVSADPATPPAMPAALEQGSAETAPAAGNPVDGQGDVLPGRDFFAQDQAAEAPVSAPVADTQVAQNYTPPVDAAAPAAAPVVQEVSDAPMPDIGAAIEQRMNEQAAATESAAKTNASGLLPEPGTKAPAAPAIPMGGSGAASGVSAEPADKAALSEAANSGPDVYYDATLNIPTGPLASQIGPRKVNPELEPASRFVVVKKAHEASDTDAQIVAANRALKLGRYDAALEMFDGLYAKNKRDQRILMGRAVAQQHSGLNDSAIRTYEELLDINPKNADALVNMMGLLREQYPEVALRRLLELQKKFPDSAGIAAQIGVTQAGLGHTEDAIKYLGIASTLEPQNAQHVYNMAIVADRKGGVKQAIAYYEQALQIDSVYGKGRTLPRDTIQDRLSKLRQRL